MSVRIRCGSPEKQRGPVAKAGPSFVEPGPAVQSRLTFASVFSLDEIRQLIGVSEGVGSLVGLGACSRAYVAGTHRIDD